MKRSIESNHTELCPGFFENGVVLQNEGWNQNPDRAYTESAFCILREIQKDKYSFSFLGKRYKGLNQIEREIRIEESRLRQKGYFKFMDRWYPPLKNEKVHGPKSL